MLTKLWDRCVRGGSNDARDADRYRRWRTFVPLLFLVVCVLGNAAPPAPPDADDQLPGATENVTCPAFDPSASPLPRVTPLGEPAAVGAIPGSFSVAQTGEATYTIPLVAPPGRAGMEPKLAISYQSNSGQGIVGVGFGLKGFSVISRCGSTLARDGVIRGVQYDAEDHFCLDGERLVQVSAEPDVVEYRTFPDSFRKVLAHSRDSSNGPAYFEVFTKDGRIIQYGYTPDSRQRALDGVNAAWWINREVDRRDNAIDYFYINDTDPADGHTIEHYPDQIRYTSHPTASATRVVHFDYQNSLLHRRYFTGGMELHHSKLLSRVRMLGPGDTEVRSYLFTYTAFAGTFRPLLEEMWECAHGVCKPPTHFKWNSHDSTGFTRHVTSTPAPPPVPSDGPASLDAKTHWQLADVTGDGLDDIVLSGVPSTTGTSIYNLWSVSRNIGSSSFLSAQQESWAGLTLSDYPPTDDALDYSTDPAGIVPEPWWGAPLDYDMDGRRDFLVNPVGRYVSTWQVLRALPDQRFQLIDTGIPRHYDASHTWTNSQIGSALLADVNGDGAADLVECYNPTFESWQSAMDYTQARWTWRPWSPSGFSQAALPIPMLDGYDCNYASITGNSLIKVVDANGDGKVDLLVPQKGYYWPDANDQECSDCTYWVLSHIKDNDWSFTDSRLPLASGILFWSYTRNVLFPDLNGDGLPDAVKTGYDDGIPRIFFNTGRGFGPAVLGFPANTPDTPRVDDYAPAAQLIDYDGDGAVDVLMPMANHCADPASSDVCWVVLRTNYLNSGLFDVIDTHIPYTPANDTTFKPRPIQVADIDGDGRHDIVAPENGAFVIYKNDGPQDLLVQVTDGMNPLDPTDAGFVPNVEIQYGNLVDLPSTWSQPPGSAAYEDAVYLPRFDDANGCDYPRSCVVGARRVVARYLLNNGNNERRGFQVRYRDGRFDYLQRAFLGFGARLVLDEDTNAGAAEFYDNVTYDETFAAYPYAGQVVRSLSWAPGVYPRVLLASSSTLPSTVASDVAPTYFTMPLIHRTERQEGQFFATAAWGYFGYAQGAVSSTTGVLSQSWHIVSDYDKYGNVLGTLDFTDGVDLQTTVHRTYGNDPTTWLIGRLDTEDVCSTALGEAQCRHRKLHRNGYGEVFAVESGDQTDPETQLLVAYGHDTFGNVTAATADDAYGHHRSSCVSYDAEHIFPYVARNGAGHTTYTSFDQGLGVLTAAVDPNGLATIWYHDAFGRLRAEVGPDGNMTTISLTRDKSGGPQSNWYNLKTDVSTTGGGERITEHDSLGRAVHTWTRGPGIPVCDAYSCYGAGTKWYIEQETQYDMLGRVAKTSLPWMTNDPASAKLYHQFAYDGANRLIEHTTPWGRKIDYGYDLNVSSVSDSAGTALKQVDPLGRPVLVTDKAGNTTAYTYGPFGGLREVSNIGEETTTVRDAYGRVRHADDPDRHGTETHYDGFGEVTSIEDARARVFTFEYDVLGRVVRRHDHDPKEGIEADTLWGYDTAPNGIGKISDVTSPVGYVKWYTYDQLARLYQVGLKIDGETFQATFGYDPMGRLQTVAYPQASGVAPLVVTREYDAFGNLIRVHDNSSSKSFWELAYVDNAGRPTLETFGNGTYTHHDYDAESGMVQGISTGLGQVLLQDLRYSYDDRLNVTSRTDALQKSGIYVTSEVFRYDALDRLVCAAFVQSALKAVPSAPSNDKGCDQVLHYAPNGNITFKRDVGDYTYDPDHPHAVLSAGQSTFKYDSVGNQVYRTGAKLSYTPFDLPSVITRTDDDTQITFDYDGEQRRIRKTTSEETRLYFEDLYERVTNAKTGEVKNIYYVAVGSATLAITRTAHSGDQFSYIHPDVLGSPDVVTDGNGNVQEPRSYDAFGARRNPKWGQPMQPAPKGVNVTYTGHEPDDEVGLINMRGRIYDPKIGRFLQTDPIVSQPELSQRWNAYSYVMNNPLKWVDPSGFDEDGAVVVDEPGNIQFSDANIQVSHTGGQTQPGYPTEDPNVANLTPNDTRDDHSLNNPIYPSFLAWGPSAEPTGDSDSPEPGSRPRFEDNAPILPFFIKDYHGGWGWQQYVRTYQDPGPGAPVGLAALRQLNAGGALAVAQFSREEYPGTSMEHFASLTVDAIAAPVAPLAAAGEARAGRAIVGLGAEVAGSSCFVAGTSVLTPSGSRAIEALRPGDLVISRNQLARATEWSAAEAVCADEQEGDEAVRDFKGSARAPRLNDIVWVLADGIETDRLSRLETVSSSARVAFQGKVYEVRRSADGTEIRETGETLQRVRQAFRRSTDRLVELTVRTDAGERRVVGTPEHPFYVPVRRAFVPMGQLKPGMSLAGEGGRLVEVVKVERHTASSEVFNVEIERTHTYFVCAEFEVGCSLVHNSCYTPSTLLDRPAAIWGDTAEDIARTFTDAGFEATIRQSTRGSQRAVIVSIKGHPSITQIQVHPGGGEHVGAYYKISTSTVGKIKIIDPATYVPGRGPLERATFVNKE